LGIIGEEKGIFINNNFESILCTSLVGMCRICWNNFQINRTEPQSSKNNSGIIEQFLGIKMANILGEYS